MYFLSKIIPSFFSPQGLSSAFILLSILLRKKVYSLLAISTLTIFSLEPVANSLMKFVEKPWTREPISLVPQGKAIVVLSGGGISPYSTNDFIEFNDPDRFLSGLSLFKSKKASFIIFTQSEILGSLTTGQIFKKKATEFGIPDRNILLTGVVRNTLDESIETSKSLNSLGVSRGDKIILVTSAFHMNRAQRLFQRQGINVTPFPVDFKSVPNLRLNNPFSWIPSSESLNRSSIAIRELIGKAFYLIR